MINKNNIQVLDITTQLMEKNEETISKGETTPIEEIIIVTIIIIIPIRIK